jgi:hypothetical protein
VKSLAKAYGSYKNIEKGSTGMVLSVLTGAPYEYYIKDK